LNRGLAEKIAHTVLYEGYMLYPYRLSSLKNQQRWNFGTLYPLEYEEVRRGSERASLHVECLLQAPRIDDRLRIELRFLQLSPDGEMAERSLEFTPSPVTPFEFPGVSGAVNFGANLLREALWKLTLDVSNQAPLPGSASREQALPHCMLSAHVVLYATGGEFISLLDPPADLREFAMECRNLGCFPVLVGQPSERDMLLCSPIILYDYPQIAPESAGDFFDATEIDEMLTLRVLTLTPEEKEQMRSADERARQLLDRTEQTAREQLARIHGALRNLRPVKE
jgi:hypothetical protein